MELNKLGNMFPTCVGMNRFTADEIRAELYVPHVRGDEPYTAGNVDG